VASAVRADIRFSRLQTTFIGAAALIALALAGCGSSGEASSQVSSSSTVPAYISEPFTHHQQLVEQGARLVISYGCSACHLAAVGRRLAPSFASFAGHRVALADGRRVLVDERFLRAALRDPDRDRLRGYDPELMRKAAMRLRLASPQQLAALAAFIEQIGPEPAPG
jgi:ABC-type amino acid transport substrate-binding protein